MAIETLAPQCGTAFELNRGDVLRVIDREGEQVADLTAFNRNDINEWLSSGRTIDYANTIYVTTNDVLYSNRSRPMFTITEDEVGRHDFLLTPCSPETFQIIYKDQHYHPSCFENLSTNLRRYGVTPDRIPTTFNIFMNVEVGTDGRLSILPPRSRAGQSITLRAEMVLIVGMTASSSGISYNYTVKSISYDAFYTDAAGHD